jgi:hypothetical protein
MSNQEASSSQNSSAQLFPIQDDSSEPRPRVVRFKRGTRSERMTSIKRRVQKYLGVDENTPDSVGAADWIKSHKGENLRADVSGPHRGRERW